MVARLEEVHGIFTHCIHDAVLLGEPAGPGAGQEVLQGFWLADSRKRIPLCRLDQVEGTKGNPPVCLHPVPKILPELAVEDRTARSAGLAGPRALTV